MASTNSTTTSTAYSSPAAGTNTSSTVHVLSTSTISSASGTPKSTAAGRPSDAWTVTTSTFVTTYSSPTTGMLTTIVNISGPSSSGSPSPQPLAQSPVTQPTTASVTNSATSSSMVSSASASQSQRRPSVAVLVVVGLISASFTMGAFFLFYRRRRRCRKEMKHPFTGKRPESCSSLLGADPFVFVAKNPASTRSVEDKDQRRILDATMSSNWWIVGDGSSGHGPLPREPRSLVDESGVTLSSHHRTPRSAAAYPRILFEQDETNGDEGQLLECRAPPQNQYESPTPSLASVIAYPLPPPRPPRSPRRKSDGLSRPSLDSVSTAHPSSAPPYGPFPEKKLEDIPYHGTIALNVQKKSTPL